MAQSTGKKDVVRGGILTGAGAAIGAGIGGAAILGTAMGTNGAAATFPAETPLNFTLQAPVKAIEKPLAGPRFRGGGGAR